jgi:hypothetical protein
LVIARSPGDLLRSEPKAIAAALSTDGRVEQPAAYFAAFLRLRLASTLKNSTAAANRMAK